MGCWFMFDCVEWFYSSDLYLFFSKAYLVTGVLFALLVLRRVGVIGSGGLYGDNAYSVKEGLMVALNTVFLFMGLLCLILGIAFNLGGERTINDEFFDVIFGLVFSFSFLSISLFKEFNCTENYFNFSGFYRVWCCSMVLISITSLSLSLVFVVCNRFDVGFVASYIQILVLSFMVIGASVFFGNFIEMKRSGRLR